jgi:hypothetical protein
VALKSRLDTASFPFSPGTINLILAHSPFLHTSHHHVIIAAPSVSPAILMLRLSRRTSLHINRLPTAPSIIPPLISSKFNRDCERCRVIGRHIFSCLCSSATTCFVCSFYVLYQLVRAQYIIMLFSFLLNKLCLF